MTRTEPSQPNESPTADPPKPKRRRRGHRVMLIIILAFVGAWLAFGGFLWVQPEDTDTSLTTTSPEEGGESTRELYHTITLPLENGKYRLGELMAAIVDEFGMDGDTLRQHANLEMDTQGFLGKSAIGIIEKTGVVEIDATESALEIRIDRVRIRRSRRELHADFRQFIEKMFPEEAAKALSRHGLFVHQTDGTRADPASVTLPESVIVLIHGLDEPGRLWHALVPALHDANFVPIEVRYPNDQAIADSAKLFADHLASLRTLGVKRVSIVSHSMGGLVSREVLTSPLYYNGHTTGSDPYPEVERFIMVGTPNQGSELARVRAMTEVRDQVVQLFSGDGMLFGGFFDGAGEAQADLLPGVRVAGAASFVEEVLAEGAQALVYGAGRAGAADSPA